MMAGGVTQAGRPLRFLAIVLGGWALFRLLLSGATYGFLPTSMGGPAAPLTPVARALVSQPVAMAPVAPVAAAVQAVAASPRPALLEAAIPALEEGVTARLLRYGLMLPSVAVPVPEASAMTIAEAEPNRLSASAWVVARGGGEGASPAPQLGGGQAGLRVVRAIDPARRIAAAGRVTTPLEGAGQEAALGVEWQPTRLPVRLVAEHRLGIDSRSGGPTVAVVGGAGPVPVAGFTMESYAATGAIGRDGLQFFAEGSVRATRPAGRVGKSALSLGGGAWAATQPGAARVDIGPSLELAVPVGSRRLRALLDWRERVGGGARPGSGPVLTLAADF